MNQLTTIQYVWIIYFAGSLGCTIAAWWMFLWAWRFVRYAAVVTVMTVVFTPYAIDAHTMTMAPAIYTLVFEGMAQGPHAIMQLVKLMVGIWLIALFLVILFIVLTRNDEGHTSKHNDSRSSVKHPSNLKHDDARSSAKRQSSRADDDGRRYKNSPRVSTRPLSWDERQARKELLREEVPMRAIRD